MATLTTALHDEGAATAMADEGYTVVYDRFTPAAVFAANDVVRSAYIPKNAVLLDFCLMAPDLDTTTNVTITARVNDGTTQKNFFATSTVGQAGGVARADAIAGAIGYEVATALFYVELLIAAGPSTTNAEMVWWVAYTNRRINADL